MQFLNVCSLNTESQMMSTWEHTQIQLLFCSPEEKDFQSYKILNECYHQLLPETECLQDSRFLCCTKYSRPQGGHKTFHLHSIYWKEYLSDNCVVSVGMFVFCIVYEFDQDMRIRLEWVENVRPISPWQKVKVITEKKTSREGECISWPDMSLFLGGSENTDWMLIIQHWAGTSVKSRVRKQAGTASFYSQAHLWPKSALLQQQKYRNFF